MDSPPAALTRRRTLAALAVAGGLLLAWQLWPAALPPVRVGPRPPSAAAPVPASAPMADASAHPPARMQTPPLPGNAFSTMEDYRRRQASRPASPERQGRTPAGRTPETELGEVWVGVRDYQAACGSNPVGNNLEITRALLGGNPRHARFLPATAAVSSKGELLDGWGHPYFFHALSGTMMEVRSAGPDGQIFTADDLVR